MPNASLDLLGCLEAGTAVGGGGGEEAGEVAEAGAGKGDGERAGIKWGGALSGPR